MPSHPLRRRTNDLLRRAGAAATTLLLATTALAQTAPNSPRLTQTGRVFACGEGVVQRCLISRDSSRALSIGADRDMVWWHIPERRALRHFDPPGERYQEPWLHPELPLVVWVAADGSGQRIDLDSDRREELSKEQVEALQPRAGLDWRRGGQPLSTKTDAVTPDGKHRLVFRGNQWSRQPSTFQSAYGEAHWLADDGTVLTARGNKFELHGLQLGERSSAALHSAPPQQLAFTPDGSHLAVVSLTSVQIVETNGNEIARLPGSLLVQPGPKPDEFWLLTAKSLQCWSTLTRRDVGESLPWSANLIEPDDGNLLGKKLRKVIVHDGRTWTREGLLAVERVRSLHPNFEAPLFVDGMALLAAGALLSKRLVEPVDFAPIRGTNALLLLTSSRRVALPDGTELCPEQANLVRVAAANADRQEASFKQLARFLVATPNGSHAGVGLSDGTLEWFESGKLQRLATNRIATPLVAAVARNEHQLIATDGQQLLQLETKTLTVVAKLPMPPWFPRVDQMVLSADGNRLAIACGSDVRILTIE